MCDLQFPHKFSFNGAGLTLGAEYTSKNLDFYGIKAKGSVSNDSDLTELYGLIEVSLAKDEFRTWSKKHLKAILTRMTQRNKTEK